MAEFKKQYKIMMDLSINKLESKVYFEINHEGWVPLGGAFTSGGGWYQTLWLPEPYWKDEQPKPRVLVEREEEEPEIFRDD